MRQSNTWAEKIKALAKYSEIKPCNGHFIGKYLKQEIPFYQSGIPVYGHKKFY